LAFLLAALLLAGGCQRLNFERSVELNALATHVFEFDPPRYEQKVAVTVTPVEGPVSAYLVKASEVKAVEKALNDNKDLPAVLASKESKEKAEEYTLEATVPAKTAYALVLYPTKKRTNVKVKVIGR
jgi:hypothetical protein